MFAMGTYNVNENDGQVQPVIALTSSSSTNISVMITVSNNNGTATGKCYKQWSNCIISMLQEVLIMFLDHTLSCYLLG